MIQRQGVTLLPAAVRRTKDQAAYYRVESGPALAARWRAAVTEAVRSLRNMPERGAPCSFTLDPLRGLRWIPIQGFPKHMAIYKVEGSTKAVTVVSILHGAQDLERELSMDVSQSS